MICFTIQIINNIILSMVVMPKQFLKLDNVTLITCYQSSYLLGMVFTNILLLKFSCSERSVLKIYIFIFLLKIRLWQNSWSMVAQICKLTVQVF